VRLAAVLAAAALLAGCGSGGSGSSAPSGDEYAAAADRVCVDLDKRSQAVTSDSPTTLDGLRTYVDRLQAILDDGVRRLDALPRPEGDAGRAARAYVAELRHEVALKLKPALQRMRRAIDRRDPAGIRAAERDVQTLDSSKLKRLAREVGADQCAS
jgi:hypothetical protein